MDLQTLIGELAQAREAQEDLRRRAIAARARMEVTPEGRAFLELSACHSEHSLIVGNLEAEVRTEALAAYEETHARRPAQGVEIKLYSRPEYNAHRALLWARENAPSLLVLDAKAFEKAGPDLPGAPITILSEPRCTIARDLSAFLAPAAEAIPFSDPLPAEEVASDARE